MGLPGLGSCPQESPWGDYYQLLLSLCFQGPPLQNSARGSLVDGAGLEIPQISKATSKERHPLPIPQVGFLLFLLPPHWPVVSQESQQRLPGDTVTSSGVRDRCVQ